MMLKIICLVSMVICLSFSAIKARRLPTESETRMDQLLQIRIKRDCTQEGCEECSVKENPYGSGLLGSSVGCCGNYKGCCKYASVICWAHDVMCTCCGSILCGPQCRKHPICDTMMSDEAEGSGEV